MINAAPFGPVHARNVKRVFAATSRTRSVVARLVILTFAALLVFAAVDLVLRLWALPDDRGPINLQPGQYDETADATLFHLRDGQDATCDGIEPTNKAVGAFIPADDATARSALLARCADVDRLYIEDMAFGAEAGTVFHLAADGWSADLAALGRPAFLMLSARFDVPQGRTAPLLPDPAAHARLLRDLDAQWPVGPGLCLDLSGSAEVSPEDVSTLLAALRPLASARGAPLCVAGTVGAAFLMDDDVVSAVDLVLAKGFRDPGRLPLPLAPQPWFEAAVAPLIYNAVLGETPTVAQWNVMFAVCAVAFILSGLCGLVLDATKPISAKS